MPNLLFLLTLVLAQSNLQVAAPTVIRVNFSIVLGHSGPNRPSSVNFTVSGDPTIIRFLVPTPGSAAVAAEKGVQCSPLTDGEMSCSVSGHDETEIAAGTIVNFYAVVAPDTRPDQISLTVIELSATGPTGIIPMIAVLPAGLRFPNVQITQTSPRSLRVSGDANCDVNLRPGGHGILQIVFLRSGTVAVLAGHWEGNRYVPTHELVESSCSLLDTETGYPRGIERFLYFGTWGMPTQANQNLTGVETGFMASSYGLSPRGLSGIR